MDKLTIEDLDKIKQKMKGVVSLREGEHRAKVVIHMGTCGIAAGARPIMSKMLEEFSKRNITDVILTSSGCAGLCSHEPMATIEIKDQPPVKYVKLTPEKMVEILEKHVLGEEIVKEYMLAIGSERTHL